MGNQKAIIYCAGGRSVASVLCSEHPGCCAGGRSVASVLCSEHLGCSALALVLSASSEMWSRHQHFCFQGKPCPAGSPSIWGSPAAGASIRGGGTAVWACGVQEGWFSAQGTEGFLRCETFTFNPGTALSRPEQVSHPHAGWHLAVTGNKQTELSLEKQAPCWSHL